MDLSMITDWIGQNLHKEQQKLHLNQHKIQN